jgi:hypothetical protein
MTKTRLVRALLAAAVAAAGLVTFTAGPADAIIANPNTLCVKPSTDVRAAYANGSCPSGFEAEVVPSGIFSVGEPACIKAGVDVRAPYNQGVQAGQCPSGEAYTVLYTGGDLHVCVKPSTDFRAPYNQGAQAGQCPSGFRDVWLQTFYGPVVG